MKTTILDPKGLNYRLPTKDDADITGRVLVWVGEYWIDVPWNIVKPRRGRFWTPMPPAPECV